MNVIEKNYAFKIDLLKKDIEAISDNECFYNNKDVLVSKFIDAVHAIADCYERNRDKLSGSDRELVLAFHYLNNQLKHDQKLTVFSMQLYSAVLPTRLPCVLGASSYTIIWTDFEDHSDNRSAGRRKYYDAYLKGKDVIETLSQVKDILDIIVEE